MTMGEKIKEARMSCGLSKEKVAELVGVNLKTIIKWESDQSIPSIENLFKLAEVLGTSTDTLIGTVEYERISSEEQAYYLYKLNEVKRQEMLRKQIIQNIGFTLIIGVAFLISYLVGLFFTLGLGKSSYTFDWVVRRRLFISSVILSTCPSLFGKYRFSSLGYTGSCLGILFGDAFGKNPAGAEFGFGHYGWFIWCITFLVSILIGIILEIVHNKKTRIKTGNK